MTKNITGKQINEWSKTTNDLPSYWGDNYDWINDRYTKKVKGEFIAKKYKAIVNLIQETNANVHINPTEIVIEYATGKAKICRDILTDNFLLPLINSIIGFQSVTL